MPQFSVLEQDKLKVLKDKIGGKLNESPQFPDVIGDRKLIRFLRGHDYDIEKVSQMVTHYLDWRRDHNINEIRQKIVLGGCDCPATFPKADITLKYIPQAVMLPYARDNSGSPICVEKFHFSPSELLKHISIPEYITFLIYCLEYKQIIVEQLSEEADRNYLASLSEEQRAIALSNSTDLPPYGHIVGLCIVRDLVSLTIYPYLKHTHTRQYISYTIYCTIHYTILYRRVSDSSI